MSVRLKWSVPGFQARSRQPFLKGRSAGNDLDNFSGDGCLADAIHVQSE